MSTVTLKVGGMTCGGCERSIERALSSVPGVRSVRADHATGRVILEGETPTAEQLRRIVEDAGFDWGGLEASASA